MDTTVSSDVDVVVPVDVPPRTWTDERVEILKDLFFKGYSASTIAAKLGLRSRNVVIGKLHRLGLTRPRSAKPDRAERAPRPPRQPKPLKVKVIKVRPLAPPLREVPPAPSPALVPEIDPLHVDLITASSKELCMFPFGDGPFTFCGLPRASGDAVCVPVGPYCIDHCVVCRSSTYADLLATKRGRQPRPREGRGLA